MKPIAFPEGFHLEVLDRQHPRKGFDCGAPVVNDWLRSKAWQNQKKHLSTTKVLLDSNRAIAGFYTLSTGQVDFGDLPPELAKGLPRRALPVAILAWLGVSSEHQGQGLGDLLFAQALRDCHAAGKTFPFIAVILDAIDDHTKAFYQRWDFHELPGHPYRLYLSTAMLESLMSGK